MKPELLGKIHNLDCLDFMRSLPDKSIDLVVTDPPYGIGNFQKTGDANKYKLQKEAEYDDDLDWNMTTPEKMVFEEIIRISKNQIIWGANYFNCFNELGGAIIWDKNNESSERYSNCEIASCTLQKKVSIVRHTWNGMIQEDMKNKEQRWHPTQKPVPVMAFCIENYSEPEQIIFDPFAGSGTTLVAAKQLGRKWLGCEISEKYCKIAEERLRQEYLF